MTCGLPVLAQNQGSPERSNLIRRGVVRAHEAPPATQQYPPSGNAPILPGATNGTIGPPGIVTTPIATVGTPSTSKPKQLPLVTVILFSTLIASLLIWGLRFMYKQKRAPIWVIGGVATAVFILAGLVWRNEIVLSKSADENKEWRSRSVGRTILLSPGDEMIKPSERMTTVRTRASAIVLPRP